MNVSRRRLVLATFAAAAVSAAGGCARPINRHSAPVGLNAKRLASGFAELVQHARPGVFDLGVMMLDTGALWYGDGAWRFPMQGVANAAVAAAALAEVDARRLKLNDRIRISAMDLSPPPSRVNRSFATGS